MSEGRVDIIEGPDSGDRSIWEDVLAIKLNGVGFHTTTVSYTHLTLPTRT